MKNKSAEQIVGAIVVGIVIIVAIIAICFNDYQSTLSRAQLQTKCIEQHGSWDGVWKSCTFK